ncbi:MAG: cytochrome c [Betaproteobacteria bacterium]|nr:cytochrome c [Betaproteobacteria bacterium]
MNRRAPPQPNAALQRELADPGEGERPLPWFLVMFLGAMTMWGAFYIYSTPSGETSAYGDQRTIASLRPPEQVAGGRTKVDGKQTFAAKCAACHQATGLGVTGVFPPLAASEWVTGDEKVLINILLHGINGEIEVKGSKYNGAMPAFNALEDNELAAVLSYIRSDWGNNVPEVKTGTVKTVREASKDRTAPFKGGKELQPAS